MRGGETKRGKERRKEKTRVEGEGAEQDVKKGGEKTRCEGWRNNKR